MHAANVDEQAARDRTVAGSFRRMHELLTVLDREHTTAELHAAARAVQFEVASMMTHLNLSRELIEAVAHRKPLPSDDELPLE